MRPRWKRVLLWALGVLGGVIVLLVAFIEVRGRRSHTAPMPAIRASTDPAVIARGEYLVHNVAHCSACHISRRLRVGERPPLTGGYTWNLPFGTMHSANITPDRETGIGAWSDAELARAIRHGVGRDGRLLVLMALAVAPLSDDELTAVVSYLRSLPAARNVVPSESYGFLGRALVAFNVLHARGTVNTSGNVPPGDAPTIERGRYLAEGAAACRACHSHIDSNYTPTAPYFAGGDPMPLPEEPGMEVSPPNLTPHAGTGVTTPWTEDDFVGRLRAGRRVEHSHMPWENYAGMTENDMRSIYRYLRSLPPVERNTGPTYRRAGWRPGQT